MKNTFFDQIDTAVERYERAWSSNLHYLLLRWIASMTAVELHATWERYTEERLVDVLVAEPRHFLQTNEIGRLRRVTRGFATYVVRSGGKYFDFRSCGELVGRSNALL